MTQLSLYFVVEQDMDPLPFDHRVVKLPHARSWGSWEEGEIQTALGRECGGWPLPSTNPPLAVGHTRIHVKFDGKALQSPQRRVCIPHR